MSRILGHSSVDITGDIYGHMIGSAARREVDNADALVPARKGVAHTLRSQAVEPGVQEAPEPATSA